MCKCKKTLLVEIGTEELPPKSLKVLAETFSMYFIDELRKVALSYEDIQWFATPRRLALKVKNLSTTQLDREVKRRGPSITKAFDKYGKPSEAAKKWAKNCGIDIQHAKYLVTDKGTWLLHHTHIKGSNAETLLPNIIISSLSKLPIQTLMSWGICNAYFIRPVHTVTVLLGNQVISTHILGIKSDRIIYGHRFIGKSKLIIKDADQYPAILLEYGKVLADYKQCKDKIKIDIIEAARKINGNVNLNDAFLEEITSLVEWPVVLTAQFKEKFLHLPNVVLTEIMQKHQKCIPVYTNSQQLLPYFIFIANIESQNPKKIISGYEKVMYARLIDAEFFFKQDRKKRLQDYLPQLKTVLFHNKLGTLYDKTNRIKVIATWIAERIGADLNHTVRACLLSKCDLMTSMVFEFPDIQGTIGMYYAHYDGEAENVALALNEQYQPRFSGDKIPTHLVSCAVAISDKIDTLVGIFGVNQSPTGNKDPFALRRSALGILRIIIEKQLDLDLKTLTEQTVYLYGTQLTNMNVIDDVIHFILGRLQTWYQKKGYSIDIIQAVLSCRPTRLIDFDARIKAISYFLTLKIAKALISVNKRISNILDKSDDVLNKFVCTSILREEAEIKLAEKLILLYDKIKSYTTESRYQDMLIEFSSLYDSVNEFFENVMVNVEDKSIRTNRLTLLLKFRELFLQVADISLLRYSS